MNKRILVAVVALVGCGLAKGDVLEFCSGPGSNCGGTPSAFESAVIADSYTYANVTDITFTGSMNVAQYLDSETQVLFSASSGFGFSGVTLVESATNTITISVPAIYSALRLNVSQISGGNDYTYLDSGENYSVDLSSTVQEIGYISPTPGSAWMVTLIPTYPGEKIQIDSFDPAGPMQMQSSDTPEVGTLLLIGAGLIAMRWMKRIKVRAFRTLQPA